MIYGVIPRGADGLIPVAEADRILDERAEFVSPLVRAANAEMKRRRRSPRTSEVRAQVMPTDDDEDGEDVDGGMIDADLAVAMLAEQPNAFAETPTGTRTERLAAAFELRLAHAQNAAISAANSELRAAAGDERQLSIALGRLHGRLRAVVDDERARLVAEVDSLLATPGEGEESLQ